MSEIVVEKFNHVHDPALEGPLPPGFSLVGREGKVRNVYMNPVLGRICLIASDRVSAFDQVSPTPIPGRGEILNDIARQELEAAEAAGIRTWFREVPEENPRASIGVLARVLPVEMIFRNYMTGSMWRTYRDTGSFPGLALGEGLHEWQDFTANPLFTPSTKSDIKDVNFDPALVEQMTGVDTDLFKRMEAVGRALFRLGTARAAERGLILVDTKYEMGIDPEGELIVIDEVHTPDSSRFVIAEGFKEAVARGERPKSLSKEFLREIILDRVGGDVNQAHELMKQPLPKDVVDEMVSRYQELHRRFTTN